MKRWEWFNKISGGKESLEKQALKMIISTAIEDYKNNSNQEMDYYPKYIDMKNWLDEGVSSES